MPESVRKAVEAEEIRAGREIPGLRHAPEDGTKDRISEPGREGRVKQYIMRVFLAFSRAICKLGLTGPFPSPQMDFQCRTFLRLLAEHTYVQKMWRRRGLISAARLNSDAFQEALKSLEKTPDWEKHEVGLREVEDRYLAELDRAAEPPMFDWASNIFGMLVSPGSVNDPHFEAGDLPVESEADPSDDEEGPEETTPEEAPSLYWEAQSINESQKHMSVAAEQAGAVPGVPSIHPRPANNPGGAPWADWETYFKEIHEAMSKAAKPFEDKPGFARKIADLVGALKKLSDDAGPDTRLLASRPRLALALQRFELQAQFYLSMVATLADQQGLLTVINFLCRSAQEFLFGIPPEAIREPGLHIQEMARAIIDRSEQFVIEGYNRVARGEGTDTVVTQMAGELEDSVNESEPEAIGGPDGARDRELGELACRREKLLDEYKLATDNPSNRGIYKARNSPIHKPQFYSWLRGELPASSATTVNFERFLREKRPPSRD